MLGLQAYKSSSDSEEESDKEHLAHLAPIPETSSLKTVALNAAPPVVPTTPVELTKPIDKSVKELFFNPKYEDLFAKELGPEHPYKTQQQKAPKNMLAGYVENAHLNEFQFETQRRTFHSYGFAIDPSIGEGDSHALVVSESVPPEEIKDKTVFESTAKRQGDKRKKEKNDKPEDIEGFKGPWAKYVDEQQVAKPTPEEAAELEELLSKRRKRTQYVEEFVPIEEKSILHIKDPVDYQGRSFLHPPHDVGVNLRSDSPPDKCFLPKALIHTWEGHTKGIATIKWFPRSAHLIISAGMDCRVKLWEVYKERRCVRTYFGHRQAVRDVSFNNSGDHFLSAAYDRYLKLWDTETGQVISRFTSRKIPYCCKFHPDRSKQHYIVAGTSDKKIICWDTRSGDIVQEYDRHLGAVNTITFVDENRRFVTTSDDKSLRVWEWDIPVDMKYIADPTMHSMPAVTLAPNQKWLACQSMDNKIVIFSALNRFKMNRKKVFTGHMVAGYACSLDFSPDMSYLTSGDADGKCYVWNWKNTKLLKKWKAHNKVCIAALWHPHEPSKLATAGWDGVIKFWD